MDPALVSLLISALQDLVFLDHKNLIDYSIFYQGFQGTATAATTPTQTATQGMGPGILYKRDAAGVGLQVHAIGLIDPLMMNTFARGLESIVKMITFKYKFTLKFKDYGMKTFKMLAAYFACVPLNRSGAMWASPFLFSNSCPSFYYLIPSF